MKKRKKQRAVAPCPYRPDPQPWPEPVDGALLLTALRDFFSRYVVLPAHGAEALALWTMHTYASDAAYLSPFVAIVSPEKRCGKSTALLTLHAVCRRSFVVNHITPAALFRLVEAEQPTLLIDEADTFLIGNNELRGVLNGNTKTATVVRCTGDEHAPTVFRVYSPKVLAMIGELPETLADRSIAVRMRRKGPGEAVDRCREDVLFGFAESLRSQALRWSNDAFEALKACDPEMPPQLNDRAADNWRPLFAIAILAGGDWPAIAMEAALALSGTMDRSYGEAVQLLIDLREIFGAEGDRLTSEEIVGELAQMEDRPWPDYNRREPIRPTQVARLLKPFGIRPRKIRTSRGPRQGYWFADCEDAFMRYIPDTPGEPEHAEQPEHEAGCDPGGAG